MSIADILVVEDEEDIQELIRYNLAKEGYAIRVVSSGTEAIDAVNAQIPDLIVLDLMLPRMDGLEVCRQIRRRPETIQTPIIMLTAKGEEADIVLGLELGADDYITKPFSPRVLLARVKAILRRREGPASDSEEMTTVGRFTIHPGRHEVLLDGNVLNLTFTEFKVLECLARRPGWVFTRNQIIDAVRGESYMVTPRAVDVQIVGLRKKLGDAGDCVETVRGVGYRFRE